MTKFFVLLIIDRHADDWATIIVNPVHSYTIKKGNLLRYLLHMFFAYIERYRNIIIIFITPGPCDQRDR